MRGEKNNCFSKIQLEKRDSAVIFLVFKASAFRYQWAITYSLVGSSTNQNAALIIDHMLDFTIKQLLDEVEHDIMNYQNRGLCYLPKTKAEADNTETRF